MRRPEEHKPMKDNDNDEDPKIIPLPRWIPGDEEHWSLGEGCRQRRKLPTT